MTNEDREDLERDAKNILKRLVENGDPFNGDDWSLVHILKDYIGLCEARRALKSLADKMRDE